MSLLADGFFFVALMYVLCDRASGKVRAGKTEKIHDRLSKTIHERQQAILDRLNREIRAKELEMSGSASTTMNDEYELEDPNIKIFIEEINELQNENYILKEKLLRQTRDMEKRETFLESRHASETRKLLNTIQTLKTQLGCTQREAKNRPKHRILDLEREVEELRVERSQDVRYNQKNGNTQKRRLNETRSQLDIALSKNERLERQIRSSERSTQELKDRVATIENDFTVAYTPTAEQIRQRYAPKQNAVTEERIDRMTERCMKMQQKLFDLV
eukprot:191395_1